LLIFVRFVNDDEGFVKDELALLKCNKKKKLYNGQTRNVYLNFLSLFIIKSLFKG